MDHTTAIVDAIVGFGARMRAATQGGGVKRRDFLTNGMAVVGLVRSTNVPDPQSAQGATAERSSSAPLEGPLAWREQAFVAKDDLLRVRMARRLDAHGPVAGEEKRIAGRGPCRSSVLSEHRDQMRRVGMALNNPLIAVSPADDLSHKSLPPTRSFASVSADDVVISAVKKSDLDGSVILRMFETEGSLADVSVRFLDREAVREVNLLEEELASREQNVLKYARLRFER
jgi:hypothetical protein